MLKNYLRVAWRTLQRQKLYAFINVAGLAIGLACCILIFLFVQNEWSFDTFHDNADRIYRVTVTEDPPERDAFSYGSSPPPLAEAMVKSFPEVEAAVRLTWLTDVITVGNETYNERFCLADPDFFNVFSFPLTLGDPKTALRDLNSVILSEQMAQKLFGRVDALGERLTVKLGNTEVDFQVAGIAQDTPENSSIRFDILLPFEATKTYQSERAFSAWFNVWLETYVLLAPEFDPSESEAKLAAVVKNNYPPRDADIVTLRMQPLTSIHLDTSIPQAFVPVSDPAYAYIMAAIAVLVLGLACINFMTLAIGRSASRAREVGVRKVFGAARSQLVRQFWGEAVLMSAFGIVLGVGLALLALPEFNQLADKNLSLSPGIVTVLFLLGLTLFVGIAAGSYPALVLSSLQPAVVIKGESRVGGAKWFGRSLVVLQFALSIALIICALTMSDQLDFLRNKPLGYDREQVIVMRNNSPSQESGATVERFRNALLSHERILGVAGSSGIFGRQGWTVMGFMDEQNTFTQLRQVTVDYDFLETMNIELAAGRNFSREFRTDSSEAILVNESLAAFFNWQDALGKSLPGPDFPPHRVVGVVRDFHFESLQSEVQPLVMTLEPRTMLRGIGDINTSFSPRLLNFISVRVAPGRLPETRELLERTWADVAPGQPFQFSFLDEDVDRQYRQEERWGEIVGYATGFALLIACMGLFGLAAMTVAKRRREIGIRKVLGATSNGIYSLLSRDFGGLVLLANVLAWPLAWLVMQRWLQDFAYRADLSPINFLVGALMTLAVAVVAVSYQSMRAATANPVHAIRDE